jgi:hypothetical protein
MENNNKSKLTIFTNLLLEVEPLFSIQFSNITFLEARFSPIKNYIWLN